LLERARERTGASVERMVKTFGELQPRGAVTRRSWYDWQERPETVSLLTGLAAMHALGPEASMELVFGEAAGAAAGVDSATDENQGWWATLLTEFGVISGRRIGRGGVAEGLRQASVRLVGRAPVPIRVVVGGFCVRVVTVAVVDGG
jgi:hypothetical protein